MNSGYAVFLVNLLQDVNVLRPLVFMAAMDLRLSVLVLVTPLFRNRDASGTWQQELEQIAAESGAMLVYYSDELEVHALLAGKRGVMVAGSESSLSAHKPVHELLRATSPGFLRITLQHGFECVGFRQSRDQDLAHGKSITFNADVICGWCAPELLNSVAATQRPKGFHSPARNSSTPVTMKAPTAAAKPPSSAAEEASSAPPGVDQAMLIGSLVRRLR